MHNKRWSKKDDNRLIEMMGLPIDELSAELQRTKASVYQRLHNLKNKYDFRKPRITRDAEQITAIKEVETTKEVVATQKAESVVIELPQGITLTVSYGNL